MGTSRERTGNRDHGTSSQEGPWKSSLGNPWNRGRKTVEQVRRGNRAGAEDWKHTGRTTAGEHREGKKINKCLDKYFLI